jgi:molybdopterin synthase sulfur carrier subunit
MTDPMRAGVVTVRLPGILTEFSGGARALDVLVEGPTSVAVVLDALATTHPLLERRLRDERGALRAHVRLYVDGTDVRGAGGTDAAVSPGAEMLVVPSVSGG